MNPKKAREFIKPTAEQLGLSEELVSDLSSFFWSEVRKAVTDLRGHNIVVPSLGTLKVKTWKLDDLIKTYKVYIEKHEEKLAKGEGMSFTRFSLYKQTQQNLEKALRIKQEIQDDLERKQQIKDKRNGKGTQGSISEQEADPGRDS